MTLDLEFLPKRDLFRRTEETQSTGENASHLDILLQKINEVTKPSFCKKKTFYRHFSVKLPTELFGVVRQKVDLVTKILVGYYPEEDKGVLNTFVRELFQSDDVIFATRIVWIGNGTIWKPLYYVQIRKNYNASEVAPEVVERHDYSMVEDSPWLDEIISTVQGDTKAEHKMNGDNDYVMGQWTKPYFTCDGRRWLLSYTVLMYSRPNKIMKSLIGVLSVDVDVTKMDLNQCDDPWPLNNFSVTYWQMKSFLGTHKCHNKSSECLFSPNQGWVSGAYKCHCRKGFYSPMKSSEFHGTLVESAWKAKQAIVSPSYDLLYVCKPCRTGCESCVDNSPCLSPYNWAFRTSLLVISMFCVVLTIVLAWNIYRYRKLKVIKVASPIFLCITLVGCAIMYSEMAAIFPILNVYSCVATKWTRHMGFCITYSALLLKTWRVSLTYRVKSAHKLKLTDKQLLQWLFPILFIMGIYLGSWTISSPPEAIYIEDWFNLKFRQCDYNWWDHSLAIGEFLFLLWGIRVCYNVRNAESFFNEAKHISWAICSITCVNVIMVMIHLVILPNADPDVKYLFGFIRTQLTTTITISFIFGPKFYRVLKGQGDTWDNRARARGVTASFSLNGVGLVHDETTDLFQENEELKEEVQKLAAQLEFMRIAHVEMNNRHLKSKYGSFFKQSNTTQSPVIKSIYMKFDSTDSPGSRICPAAELISERV
ncbi:putative G-protein coupled receptor CG31760 isoform X2 [Tachypleus tridentatus]|uniref:putative G-protein coupled receptor CG31760 isoform X2 n=1 Tax=Tachypleus tridentatus TaxID=6853 RepID=UPI003FD6BCB9